MNPTRRGQASSENAPAPGHERARSCGRRGSLAAPAWIGRWLAWGWLAWLFLGGGWLLPVWGIERFPPPDFESGYTFPATTLPEPRPLWRENLDVAVLLGTLAMAAYLALRRRSRRGLLGLTIFSLAYFGFYRQGCICAIGSIQDVALALFQPSYQAPLTVLAFFLLPLLFALFFGRVFCGSVCPLGAIQELVVLKPVKVAPWLEHGLGMLAFVYLGMAVLLAATGSAFPICQYDPFVALFRRTGSVGMLGLGAVFLGLGVFIGRPYCRFLCPYGALLGLIARVSKWAVSLFPNDCLLCQLCDVACPYGAIREPTEAAPTRTARPPMPVGESRPKPAWSSGLLWLAQVPVWVAVGVWLGGQLGVPLSKLNPTVLLAEEVVAAQSVKGYEPTDAVRGFRQTGRPVADLELEAGQVRAKFATGGWVLGGFLGLVFGIKLASFAFRSASKGFEPERSLCVACGRCYPYCPKELVRVKRERAPVSARAASSSEPSPPRSAGFQPAVSPTSSRQSDGMPTPLAFSEVRRLETCDTADWKSALRSCAGRSLMPPWVSALLETIKLTNH